MLLGEGCFAVRGSTKISNGAKGAKLCAFIRKQAPPETGPPIEAHDDNALALFGMRRIKLLAFGRRGSLFGKATNLGQTCQKVLKPANDQPTKPLWLQVVSSGAFKLSEMGAVSI